MTFTLPLATYDVERELKIKFQKSNLRTQIPPKNGIIHNSKTSGSKVYIYIYIYIYILYIYIYIYMTSSHLAFMQISKKVHKIEHF